MCGISGFNFNDRGLINKMNSMQKLRGPDGEGVYFDENISLGHRRLAIIDLTEQGKQPMTYKHLTIVFNGEIYNFKDIKEELKNRNHNFYSNSDTEVILHAYEEWGVDCLKRFNGMWSFCIYDKNKQELFLSRDRFGIKPLFYFHGKRRFIFASEIKAIQQHELDLTIDKVSLNHFFFQKYIGGDKTVFSEIKKLEPSKYAIYNLSTQHLNISQYYNLTDEIEQAEKLSFKEKKANIKDILADAIEKRLISDVPVGSFLSGGIDSSFISASIAKTHPNFKVFSIGFNEDTFDELNYAKMVAKNINVKHFYKTLKHDENIVYETIDKIDEPFGDPSIVPTALLSMITREHVTVSLSGDAGDEVFGGYDTYLAWKIAGFFPGFAVKILKSFVKLLPASDRNLHLSFKVRKFIEDWDKDIQNRHLNWMSQTNVVQRKGILGRNYIDVSDLFKKNKEKGLLALQLNDIDNYLCNDILRKVDMASMIHSLEARVPFLDHRLVPLVLSLKSKHKIRRFRTKFLLKKIAADFIPKQILRRKKAGFSVPLSLWFKQSEKMRSVIKEKSYFAHQLINYKFAQELLKEHLERGKDNSRILWLIFVFNLWYKKQNSEEIKESS